MKFLQDVGFDPIAKLGIASGSMSFFTSFLVADVFGYVSYVLGAIPLMLGGVGAYYSFRVKKGEAQKMEHEIQSAEIEKKILEMKLKEMQKNNDYQDNKK